MQVVRRNQSFKNLEYKYKTRRSERGEDYSEKYSIKFHTTQKRIFKKRENPQNRKEDGSAAKRSSG